MWFFPGSMAFVLHGTALLTKRGLLPIVVLFAFGIDGAEAAAQPADALSGGGSILESSLPESALLERVLPESDQLGSDSIERVLPGLDRLELAPLERVLPRSDQFGSDSIERVLPGLDRLESAPLERALLGSDQLESDPLEPALPGSDELEPGLPELDLRAAATLALTTNRDIEAAYLGRVSDEYGLRVAEDRFRPDLTINASRGTGRSGDPLNRIGTDTTELSPRLSLLVPTGGQVSFTWANRRNATSAGATHYRSGLDISFVQPLLSGAGIDVNLAPLRIARISERSNVLSLKSTINSTITAVVTAYRQLLLQERRLEIVERSLARARTLLENNRAMIEAGRMARQDIVQTETEVSQRELDLVSARNSLDTARLALLDILDIDPETPFRLTDTLRLQDVGELDFESTYAHALANQPNYLQALLRSEIVDINLQTAKNQRLWRLDATLTASLDGDSGTGYRGAFRDLDDDPGDYRAGLQLTIPFGDLNRRQQVINARISKRRQELSLLELRETIRIDIKDQVRSIKSLREQVDLAERAAELAARQLDIEQLKLAQGRSSNFQVLNLEDQLISAQISEASAVLNYLNALTRLDQALGMTMDTWGVPFEVRRYEPEAVLNDKADWDVLR